MLAQKRTGLADNGRPIYFGSKDKKLFSEIFIRYYAALCTYASRMVGADYAEDVIEGLFANLWLKEHQFENETHLRAFLYQSAKNSCINFITSDLRANERNTRYAESLNYIEENYLSELTRSETIRALHEAISKLPPQVSKVIKMGYVEGFSNVEIAEKLNLSLQTVKNHKLRGVNLLREHLPDNEYLVLLIWFLTDLTH